MIYCSQFYSNASNIHSKVSGGELNQTGIYNCDHTIQTWGRQSREMKEEQTWRM